MTLLLTQDFENDFEFTSPGQLQGMSALQPERSIEVGNLGKLSDTEISTYTCTDACKLLKSSKRCYGSRCIGLLPEKKVKKGQTNELIVGYSLEGNIQKLELDFNVWVGKMEKKTATVYVDFSVDGGNTWQRLHDYGKDDIKNKKWTKIPAKLDVPASVTSGQPLLFRLGSNSKKSQVRVDSVEIWGMS